MMMYIYDMIHCIVIVLGGVMMLIGGLLYPLDVEQYAHICITRTLIIKQGSSTPSYHMLYHTFICDMFSIIITCYIAIHHNKMIIYHIIFIAHVSYHIVLLIGWVFIFSSLAVK